MAGRGGLDIGNAKEKRKELITKVLVARENIRAWIKQLRELENEGLDRRVGRDKSSELDTH
uniref:Uncharacterized protein n=1 Tax=viral metagenome TaxID=1070528 RepID=A0A6H2A5P6_9ZZZZ